MRQSSAFSQDSVLKRAQQKTSMFYNSENLTKKTERELSGRERFDILDYDGIPVPVSLLYLVDVTIQLSENTISCLEYCLPFSQSHSPTHHTHIVLRHIDDDRVQGVGVHLCTVRIFPAKHIPEK